MEELTSKNVPCANVRVCDKVEGMLCPCVSADD